MATVGTPSRQESSALPAGADLSLQIEAALLTTDRPLPTARLGELLGDASHKAVQQAIAQLNELYEKTDRSFRIEAVAGGWQIMTLPRFAPLLANLHQTRQQTHLTPAAMETLAVIAYRQPILRADVEAVRGVACGEVIRSLMDRHLVKIVGRAEEIGRPMLYGTTKTFLEVFGLSSLDDLPKVEALKSQPPAPGSAPGSAPASNPAPESSAAAPANAPAPNSDSASPSDSA